MGTNTNRYYCGVSRNKWRRYPDSQINIIKVDSIMLSYTESYSQKLHRGIADEGKNPARVTYYFCSGFILGCLVELFKKYLFLGPREASH